MFDLHFLICYMIRIELEVEVTNFFMDQKFDPALELEKINGCLGRLVRRIETLIKRRILSKIEVQMKRIISLCFRSPITSNRIQLGGETYA